MRTRVQAVFAGAGIALGFLSVSGIVLARGTDPQAEVRSAAKAELKAFKTAVGEGLAFYAGQFDALAGAVASGSVTPAVGFAAAADLAIGAQVGLHSFGDSAARNLESFVSSLGSRGFPGSLAGDGGELDRFRASMARTNATAQTKVLKELRDLDRAVSASTGFETSSILVSLPDPPALAPNPGESVPPTLAELKVFAILGGSDVAVEGDGSLCVGGIADASLGAVTVTVYGPGGASASQGVGVNPGNSRWLACFNAPGLAEGNWRVLARQGLGAPETGAIGIP